jgi:hypothetical protein
MPAIPYSSVLITRIIVWIFCVRCGVALLKVVAGRVCGLAAHAAQLLQGGCACSCGQRAGSASRSRARR